MTKNFQTKILVFLILIVATASIQSCKQKESQPKGQFLEVVQTNFGEEIKDKSNLVFTFNHPMIKSDTILHQWIEADFFNITPKVDGKYKWLDVDQLSFSPVSGFENATEYELSFNKSLLKKNKKIKEWVGLKTYRFHTPYLEVTGTFAAWSKENGNIQPKITAFFNLPVSSDILKDNVTIEIDKKSYPYEIKSNPNSNEHTFVLLENPDQSKSENINVIVGVIDNFNKEESNKFTTLEPSNKLKIKKIETAAEGISAVIKVYASQKIEVDAIKSKLEIKPKIKYDIVPTFYGFDITSEEIQIGNGYKVTLKKGLEGTLGGQLKNDYVQQVSFGNISPEIAFDNDKATYLGKMGNKNVSVKIVGIPKVKVSVYKVFENNLLHFLYRGKEYGSYYNYEAADRSDRYHSYYYYETSDVGQLIHEEEIFTESLDELGISRILKIDFADKLQDKNGIYVVKVQDAEKYYLSDSKLISLSDIGIIAKEDKDNVYIFCNSIKTANPKSGTEVKLISSHNQIITSQTVSSDGIAKFSKSSFKEGFYPKIVVTKNGTDFNYMNLNNSRYMTSRFDVGGARTEDVNYDLFMYAERSLYRPGETIHLAGILRDFDWNVIEKMPILVKLKSPEGKEYASARVQLDDQGMFTSDFSINSSSMTGTYLAEAYTGKDIYLGSKTIQVEEFMPDRIKVDLELDKETFEVGDSITGEIIAMNYFGPPAANNTYESELTINQGYFNPKGYHQYSFQQQKPFRSYQVYDDGKTDLNGKAQINYIVPKTTLNNGILNGRIYATVFDETGRPVHKAKRFSIQTQDVFIGIGHFDRWIGTKKPLQIPLIALDKAEKPTSQEVEIEVIKYSWHSTLRYDNGRYRYVSEKESISVSKEMVNISGDNTNYYFTPKNSGSYEVIIRVPETKIVLSKSFYAYQYNDTYNNSFEVNNEGNIDISFDKESYQPGENATAILKLPFDGKVLVTTERNQVMSYVYLDSKDKVVTYPIKVADKHTPNTYVTATLIKPHDGSSSLPLTVAHGFESFEVKPNKAKLKLEVKAVEKSRSKTKQTITIKTEPNAHLTVAVVDEGILALGNQKTPDPYNHFYAKRALEVYSSDLYPFLFPEITATGGDAEAMLDAEMENRQNPLQNKRVKLVSFWSDLLKTDNNGKVSFDVDIPQFSGSLRVMAVASKDEKFGSIEENITVADPLVLSSSIPRFLSMGDEWEMSVNMANTTDKTIKGKLNIATEGPLTANESGNISVEIPPNGEAEQVIKVKAGYKIDVAKITTSVNALNEKFVEETDITIRPAASLVKKHTSGIIKAGETKTIEFSNQFLTATDEHKVFISKSPLAQFTNDIDELISYPFGCVEQTVSKAFPQIYFEDLVESIYEEGTEYDANEIKRNVQAAIDKIRIMQLSNGGLSYWPNSGNESWWGTIYAAHFLIEAREKGYQVNQKTLTRMLGYLQDKLKKKEKVTYYYNGSQKREIVRKEVGYSLYVLALAGKPDYGSMKHYLNDAEELSLDAKYLLACSFILTNDITSARRLLPASFSGEKSVPTFGGSFYSYIRDLAISTNALIEADPNHPQIPGMIQQLSSEMSSKKYLNTQEMSFGFLAMGKYARLTPIGKANATVVSNGKTIQNFTGKDVWLNYNTTEYPLEVKVDGEGSVFYFVESKGIPSDDKVTEVDNHLKVRREFYTKDKRLVTNGMFKQNDLIVVKVTLQSLTGSYIENVAITDVLPAGFEIENARIAEMPDLSWLNTNMQYDFRDIRDDRIHFFTTAGRNTQTFYYLVRAVTPGTYQLGPVSADAMYNGEYHSYHGSGKIIVE